MQLASLAVLLLSWVYVFDLLSREREVLEGPQEGITGVAPAADLEAGRRTSARQVIPNPGPACLHSVGLCCRLA